MPNIVSYYDDGSVLVQDESLNVLGGRDVTGAAIVPAGSGASNIGDRFMDLLNFGVRAAIVNRYGTAATNPQGYVTTAQAQAQAGTTIAQFVPLLLIVGAGILLYKLAS